jgi:tetratricopeptide (TPR) repeat protein
VPDAGADEFSAAAPPPASVLPSTRLPADRLPRTDTGPALVRGLDDVRRHADRGAWEKASRCCEELLNQDDRNSGAHFYHGLVLYQMHRSAEAERSLRRAIELDRESVLPRYYLGLFLQSRGDLRQAAQSLENVLELLSVRRDAEIFADADGITAVELKKLVTMHLHTLRERA